MNEPNQYRQGEHICAVYHTADEQRAVAADYLSDGLRRGERVYYVDANQDALDLFNQTLAARGIDVADALRTTALMEATHREAHLADGSFDSERMLRLLNDAIEAALNAGFAGLRTCGDMSWLLDEPPGAEQVVEYEAHLNQLFCGTRACGMCQYDAARLPPALLEHAMATHSTVVANQAHTPNPFYRPAAEAASGLSSAADVDWRLGPRRRL